MIVVTDLDLTHVEDPLGLGVQSIDIALRCPQTGHQSGEELSATDGALHLAVTGDRNIVLVDFLSRIRRSTFRCLLSRTFSGGYRHFLLPHPPPFFPKLLSFLFADISLTAVGQSPEGKDYQQDYEFDGQCPDDAVHQTLE